MFDSTESFELTANTDNGPQPIKVRWPTDQEWDERAKSKKTIMKNLGRGKSQMTPAPPTPADLKLYNAIQADGGPELNMAEACMVLNLIGLCQVTNIEFEGNEALVDLQVSTGPVQHRLRIPSAAHVIELQRINTGNTISLPFDHYETRASILPSAKIYDACGGRSEDYIGPVPAPHKDVVVRGVVHMIEREFGPKQHEQNF